ncbi:hypothetical protein [Streptomyces sp. WAC 04229]|uniref:hypothetical protein n=1 Tax=Streptomyces sp. WAC 04229 TaxID=2203206 RepID=UPI00163C12EF|nr:hypothetical protein [Streptomyces sp. WAC 04229]
MPNPDRGGLSFIDARLLQTLARGTDSGNKTMIMYAAALACVINGDTMTDVLRQATWLVVAVIILIIVQETSARLPRGQVKHSLLPDTSA